MTSPARPGEWVMVPKRLTRYDYGDMTFCKLCSGSWFIGKPEKHHALCFFASDEQRSAPLFKTLSGYFCQLCRKDGAAEDNFPHASDCPLASPAFTLTEEAVDKAACALWEINHPNPPGWAAWGDMSGFGPSSAERETTKRKARSAILAFLNHHGISPAPWTPTHRHYKGGLYRELMRVKKEADLSITVVYENAAGEGWERPAVDFDEVLETEERGVFRRFAPITPKGTPA